LASLAGTAPAERGGAEGAQAACGGQAGGGTSVAAIRSGRGRELLAGCQSAWTGEEINEQPGKGTFSRELIWGHFK
jgi:hypothetical protein